MSRELSKDERAYDRAGTPINLGETLYLPFNGDSPDEGDASDFEVRDDGLYVEIRYPDGEREWMHTNQVEVA